MKSINGLEKGDLIKAKSKNYKYCRMSENEQDVLVVEDEHGNQIAMKAIDVEEIAGKSVEEWNKSKAQTQQLTDQHVTDKSKEVRPPMKSDNLTSNKSNQQAANQSGAGQKLTNTQGGDLKNLRTAETKADIKK